VKHISSKILLCGSLLLSFNFNLPAHAAEFEQGCEFYQAKNFAAARSSFETAAKTFPQNWLVHYYLANTYLALSQKSIAKREYEKCLTCKPNAVTAGYCRDAVIKLGGPTAQPVTVAVDPSAASKDPSLDKNVAVVKTAAAEAEEKHSTENEAKAGILMAAAEAKCATIRAEARQKVAEGGQTGNQWYCNRRDGTIFVDLRDEEKEEIHREAEERCTAVMTFAEHQTRNLRK